MAVLTYSSALQDRIAYRLWNQAYSALTAGQKADIDGTSAANPPTAGVARAAYMLVNALGQWVQQIDKTAANVATTVDDAAEAWFIDEACFRLAQTHRRSYIAEAKALRDETRGVYYDTFTSLLATGYTADVYTLTPQSIRFYVLRRVIQFLKPGQGVFPSPEEIDGVAFDVLTWFWNSRQWNFRRRQITIDIPTTGNGASPTINTASGETFDSLVTRNLYYSGTTRDACSWASADQMAAMKSDTSASTGKPSWFRIQRTNDTFSWIWHPYPDAAYTVRCECLIKMPGTTTPGVPDSATDTVPYAKIPPEFRAMFKELVLGKVLFNRGMGDVTWKSAVDQLERAAPDYDDHGDADLDGAVRDVYQDAALQPGPVFGTWRWPADVGGSM